MFEYHGWVRLRSTASAVDDELPLRLAEIRELVAGLSDYGLMDLRALNGDWQLHFAGCPNHRGTHGSAIIELFGGLGRLAPGSYGLLYVWDDESPLHSNEYRVHRLVRGEVTEHSDRFLSPAVPTVED